MTTASADPGNAFDRLHPGVQRWIYEQRWDRLRSVQAHSVGPILDGQDVVIAAATASGKTEAAWLPICSRLADQEIKKQPGIKALYLGPLKALINDQHLRLEPLGERIDVPVHPWHGDVAGGRKRTLMKNPDGILLITPESLEAMFVREGHRLPAVFAGLQYFVVDELHDFIGTERGAQLQSLMHRLELAIRRRVPRIGLSATLSDLAVAADFLRPGHGQLASIIDNPGGDIAEIKLQLRGYVKTDPKAATVEVSPDDEAPIHANDARSIAEHLYATLRGKDNLVFANKRSAVEAYVDILHGMSEDRSVPNEFFPHHGNLSKEYREDVERRLRALDTPTTAVCTSTLEMGIDIGSTDAVAQIGAPYSVAALRQRLGRSGRRDQPAILRIYVSEGELTERTPPADQLRAQLVQSIAMVELMLKDRWFEPPNTSALHLSTLTQQILSMIAQHGGATAQQLYTTLCGTGPFSRVDKATFVDLLSDLGTSELLTQSSDGLLLHGERGDQLVNHYSFYTAFQTADEYRLVTRGRTLGSIPVDYPVLVGGLLIFAGRRWQVVDVDSRSRIIELTRSSGGRPPMFSGGGGEVADLVRQRMRSIYESSDVPVYLNNEAQGLLDQARASYRRLGLDQHPIVAWGNDTLVFCWRGDRILNTLAVALNNAGLRVSLDGVALQINDSTAEDALTVLRNLAAKSEPDPEILAASVGNKHRDKYDEYLSDHLLAKAYAAHSLDVPGAWSTLRDLSTAEFGIESILLDDHPSPAAPTYPRLGETPFAVIDLETTGFAGHLDDRVIEIAIVHTDPHGHITGQWSTLVNPGRGAGPTQIHGLHSDDLANAPYFAELTDWLTGLLAARVVVAHNAAYDLTFLTTEYERADVEPPDWATLCTLELNRRLGATDSLALGSCCAAHGITLNAGHTALGDATATAHLLQACLSHASSLGMLDFPSLGSEKPLPLADQLPTPATPRLLPRRIY
ncbi:DEAD/DEAH box helicase [Kribbella sp. NPDC051620]|uniref:DEAD/DEAH box helicase n=1 Tax=Kribbella sp. NPDC051620 TaxID=3364120 RepID=UPI0037A50F72